MYTLMNKDRPLIDFEFDYLPQIASYEVRELTVYERPWFINDLGQWVRTRHAPKHRGNIGKLLSLLELDNIKAMFDCSKGLSLSDTLWVNCDDRYQWEKVNLYENPLDEAIAGIAFDGCLQGHPSRTASPELTTDGALAKCWVREGSEIFLLKQGSAKGIGNSGPEPYVEQYCCQILDTLGWRHVHYEAVIHHSKLASKCKRITTQKEMMLPLSACLEKHTYKSIVDFCTQNNMLHSLYQTVLFDYLVTNNDRHLNNIAVLMDANTFQILGLAPIYDNGVGLLPYAVEENLTSYADAVAYASGKRPRFYDSFFRAARLAMEEVDSKDIQKLSAFSFSRKKEYSLAEWRLSALEEYVCLQAKHLLDGSDPMELIRKGIG